MKELNMKSKVASGNAALDTSPRPGTMQVYDRGELLWLIAASVLRGACLEKLAGLANLTEAEIADCRSMID